LSIAILLAPISAAVAQPSVGERAFDSGRFGALTWYSNGPRRGGRAVAVAGVPTQPLVYYAGFAGGGVWKTDDAGANWRNVSDCCFRMGSVGAIAIAETNPNVIYVGMGEHAVRAQASSFGDGMYKSTDAGLTWKHAGLKNTRQISRVIVHPKNDSVLFVAAQGSRWGPSADRGIYRSLDGGATWKLLLHPSDSAGASELSMDPSNPRVLYAAFWHGERVPWQVQQRWHYGRHLEIHRRRRHLAETRRRPAGHDGKGRRERFARRFQPGLRHDRSRERWIVAQRRRRGHMATPERRQATPRTRLVLHESRG